MAARKTSAQSMSNSTKTTKKHSPDASEDYSIWLSMDGIKTSAPWRLGSYGDDGVLSDSDMLELAERFKLPSNLLQTLSRQLGYCLDVDSEVNLVRIKRSKAIERADKELAKATKLAKKLQVAAAKLSTLLTPLNDQFAQCKEDAALLLVAKAQADELGHKVASAMTAIQTVRDTPGAAAVMTPFNKVYVWDKRRQHVVETCGFIWREAGRPVTLTTKHDNDAGKKRMGQLYDFIQAVVVKLTEPPRELSGETIRKDLDRFKKDQAKPDELTTPPDRGIDTIR